MAAGPIGLGDGQDHRRVLAPSAGANGERGHPVGPEQLETAGNLHNLRFAAGIGEGEAIGPIFADSDVYKWLEAAAWEYAPQPGRRAAQAPARR